MTVEEVLEIVERALDQGRSSKVQDIVLRQSWDGRSYLEIAKSSGYEVGYVRDVGYKLWKSLSQAFGKKVTKNNFHGILKQQYVAMHGAAGTVSTWAELPQIPAVAPKQGSAVDSSINKHQYWGEAIDVSNFHGRTLEIDTLKQWIVHDGCRLVALLGMGGIGKSYLAMRLAQQVQPEFEYLIWHPLRNSPSLSELLAELILFLSNQQEVNPAETLDSQISCLMAYLRQHRCLLVLDNAESILQGGELAGHYRSGYERYGQLLRRVADECHQSCLVLTSREKPIGLTSKEGRTLPVRSLQLSGLSPAQAQEMLIAKGLSEVEDEFTTLIESYSGNPLALKIVATTIQHLFDGDVAQFLTQGTIVFGEIEALLDQHFNRLSSLEKQLMYCLATQRKWIPLPELLQTIIPKVSPGELLEALESLQKRSLIERNSDKFTQQNIFIGYITKQLNLFHYSS